MASMHIHHPVLSVCFRLASFFTFGTELFSGLTGKTYREVFFPLCGNWPERVRPSQRVWGSAELQLICTRMEDSLHYLCPSPVPIYTGSGGHPCLARHSQLLELSLLQTNGFISIYLYLYLTSMSVCLSAEFKQQLQCKILLCLRWCWKFKPWWSPCTGSSSGNNAGKILATTNCKRVLATVSPYSYFLFFLMFFQCFYKQHLLLLSLLQGNTIQL